MTTPAINVTNLKLQSGSSEHRAFFCNGTISAPSIIANQPFLWRTESRPASVSHPRNRAGWRAPGAWNHTKITDTPIVPGTMKRYDTLPGAGCSTGAGSLDINGYGMGLDGISLPAFPSYLEGRAVSRALLKLKHQNVNLSVAFAERKQTQELFSHNARTIAKQVNDFKRKSPKQWGQVVRGNWRNTPSRWLELQYGWKPLISDIQGACEEISDHFNAHDYLVRVKGHAGEDQRTTYRKTWNSAFYGFDIEGQWKHRSSVSLYYELRSPVLAKFASLGLTNPLELAWEKMKYSFVIDWFLPVGNWLSTLDADFGWDFHSGTATRYSSGEAKGDFHATGLANADKKVEYFGPPYTMSGIRMTRSVYSSAPWGGIPRFKNPLSSQHVANAMSLLSQAFRR